MARQCVLPPNTWERRTHCTLSLNHDIGINPNLCARCQCWNDLTHMMSCTPLQWQETGTILYKTWGFVPGRVRPLASADLRGLEFRSLEDMTKAQNCLVCQTLLEGLRRHESKTKPNNIALHGVYPGKQFLYGLDQCQGLWTDKFIVAFCLAYPQGEHDNPTPPQPGVLEIELSYSDGLRGFKGIKLWDRRFVDIEKAKNWMSHCHDHHEMCDKRLFRRALPHGFLVINVETECIVEPHRDISDYVALSYQWATATAYKDRDVMLLRSNKQKLQRQGSLSAYVLPEVIQDSMQFCRDIGQRYLWVDRLCIYQDKDDGDGLKQAQIAGMGAIYWLATVTLVASADGVGVGLPGVSSRPRLHLKNHGWGFLGSGMNNNTGVYFAAPGDDDLIEPSYWNTRGWTFQERWISRRLIFFGHSHCMLNCFYCGHCEESFKDNGTLKEEPHWDMTHGVSYGTDVRTAKSALSDSTDKAFSLYTRSVHMYTLRSLGLASDILNAFSGVNEFSVEKLRTTSLFGLPENYLFQSLLWVRTNTPSSIPKGDISQGLPSWSWASGYGPVRYSPCNYMEYGNIVRFWYSENGTVREVVEATCWFDRSHTTVKVGMSVDYELNRLHEDTQRRIDKWKLPGPGIYETCPHHPREAIKHRQITDESYTLAVKTPGCLAFNTTVVSLRVRVNEAKRSEAREPENLWEQLASARGHARQQPTTLDIIDDERARIGYTFSEVFPTGHKLPPVAGEDFKCHAVVIGAYDWADFKDDTQVTYDGKALFNRGKWSLIVMIVDRKEHLSSRLAIGVVHPLLWEKVRPTWQTVFLV
ncbi:heterokaryon incompatibility protein-domain-containing protein [Xylaria grammica]|nr:heterokaryon incompatibility protein-domain-containing protein [Xylaria grammica]